MGSGFRGCRDEDVGAHARTIQARQCGLESADGEEDAKTDSQRYP